MNTTQTQRMFLGIPMMALVCLALVTGCRRQEQQIRPIFDCDSAIARIQSLTNEYAFCFGPDATSEDHSWERTRYRNYLSLLMRYRETKTFEVDEYGCTALMHAVKCGTVDEVKGLLSVGIDVNAKDKRGKTALLIASCSGTDDWGDVEIVKALLSAGADVNVTDEHGYTALGFASLEGNEDLVKLLLSAGADVNGKGFDGTALMSAAMQGRLEVVKMLLAAGADVNTEQSWGYGRTILRNAVAAEEFEIVRMLLSAGAKDTEMSPKDRDALWNDTKNIEAVTMFEETALMAAAKHGYADIVKVLLDAGSDVINTKNMQGDTALSLAKTPEIAELLRKAGAKE